MLPPRSPAARLPTLPLVAACSASADPSPAMARDSGSFLASSKGLRARTVLRRPPTLGRPARL
eukprot:6601712-Heterocapsa_arctica.AAC.1